MMLKWLPQSQWHALEGTELEAVHPHLPPEARVWVIEDAQHHIIACGAFFPIRHHEGLWVNASHRGNREVWTLIGDVFAAHQPFLTASASAGVARLLERVGAEPLPGVFWRCAAIATDPTNLPDKKESA
jgi:hypothetical protein